MRYANVLHALGWLIAVIGIAMALPLLVAMAFEEKEAARAFVIGGALAGFSGGGLIVAFRGVSGQLSRAHTLLLLVLGWTVLPIFAAFPFAFLGAPSGSTSSYFEAVSGLTTTGATLLSGQLDNLPKALLVWRAGLQWLGGLGTITVAVVMLAPLGIGGMELRRSPLARGDTTSLIARLRQTASQVIGVYGALTFLCFGFIWVGGVPGFDAFCLALSTISTGGFLPRDGNIDAYQAPLSAFILCLAMIIGGLSFAAHRAAFRGSLEEYRLDPEVGYLAAFILILGALLSLTIFFETGSGQSALTTGYFLSISLATTTGFMAGSEAQLASVPPVLALGAVLIGGATLSTAGGLKLMRLALMFKQAGRELKRLAHPHGIISTKYGNRAVELATMKDVWIFFILFLASFVLVTIVVSASGIGMQASMGAAAAALSNTGPAYDILRASVDEAVPYAQFPVLAKWALSAAMILGRVEILAVLSLFNIAYWRS